MSIECTGARSSLDVASKSLRYMCAISGLQLHQSMSRSFNPRVGILANIIEQALCRTNRKASKRKRLWIKRSQQELKVRLRCAWRPDTDSPLIIFQFVASRRRGRPPVSRPGLPGHLVITLSCVHPVQVGTQLDGTEDRALMLWPITAVHT